MNIWYAKNFGNTRILLFNLNGIQKVEKLHFIEFDFNYHEMNITSKNLIIKSRTYSTLLMVSL